MVTLRLCALVLAVVAGVCLVSCDARAPASIQSFLQYVSDLDSISAVIAKATGYPQDHLEVSGNRTYLHISIFDATLMDADTTTLEKAATAVVAAAEPVVAAHTEFSSVAVISVGIRHPSGLSPPIREWHSENVLEFHRGPDQRFVMHVP